MLFDLAAKQDCPQMACRAGQGRAGQGRAGQGRAEQELLKRGWQPRAKTDQGRPKKGQYMKKQQPHLDAFSCDSHPASSSIDHNNSYNCNIDCQNHQEALQH